MDAHVGERSHTGGRALRAPVAGVADFFRGIGDSVQTDHSGRRAAAGAHALAFVACSDETRKTSVAAHFWQTDERLRSIGQQ
jgi:hypothetical protein